jgi:hypothetical protein
MSKNIVVCCDGTGNQVEGNLSNVLKLFRILQKNERQRVYYNPGIGTIGTDDPWTRLTQNTKGVFELATGYGLDACRALSEGRSSFSLRIQPRCLYRPRIGGIHSYNRALAA